MRHPRNPFVIVQRATLLNPSRRAERAAWFETLQGTPLGTRMVTLCSRKARTNGRRGGVAVGLVLSGSFGALAWSVAAIGTYSVLSYP